MSEIIGQIPDNETKKKGISSHSVKKGLFIEERFLEEAELGSDIQIKVYKGKIIIVPKTKPLTSTKEKERKQAIDKFLEFIRNAPEGKLQNPSQKHDEYLYGAT